MHILALYSFFDLRMLASKHWRYRYTELVHKVDEISGSLPFTFRSYLGYLDEFLLFSAYESN